MRKASSSRFIAAVFAILITVGMPFSSAGAQGAQGLEGCLAGGVAPTVDYYLPHLWGNWVIVSDERRNAEELAATFADPADALARLHAWCWIEQAERVYVSDERRSRDQLTVDVSIHDFLGSIHDPPSGESVGASQAQSWFADQRANDLGLHRDIQTREELEEELSEGGVGPVYNIEALDDIDIEAYSNDTEYTLYARQGTGTSTQGGSHLPPDLVVRVTVSAEPSVGGRSREAVAYWVLAQVFGVDLFWTGG